MAWAVEDEREPVPLPAGQGWRLTDQLGDATDAPSAQASTIRDATLTLATSYVAAPNPPAPAAPECSASAAQVSDLACGIAQP